MNEEIKQALEALNRRTSEEEYFAACTTLVNNRDKLPYRVQIELPGGLMSNRDPRWDAVRAGSEARCSCGNERTILPLNPRTEFEPAPGEVAVPEGRENAVFLKPRGGDRTSAYMALWIDDGDAGKVLAFKADPFGPLMLNDLFSTPAYALADLAKVLAKATEPAVMVNGKDKIPMFAISKVDLAGSATLTLDKDVEVLTKDEIEGKNAHQH